ncbi:Eco57I restriction-modification methylase domain-containing protein [[Clostridium] polysaccharolyticum]|uniref:site-specific DNA-methyltransferase (adenine-specific) n=1 Tax=[Clostridium] polysaccharolyticum TaxID=29364 RepID=A0A1H9ZTR7_9FIRM|nr:class I SAM-dependent methyltransferase [[Clostridium] polysaccharolyticum]SES84741.1 adenine-specific DNA-methyltransferase [[Clostridium] polysaccharolyticum]
MLERIIEQTNEYIEKRPKHLRKQFGQFFTSKETAMYMAKMFAIPEKEEIYILDPGAGTGILACALIEELERQGTAAAIHLTCYENDENVIELLRQNLKLIQDEASMAVDVRLYEENYIVRQEKVFNGSTDIEREQKYDLIIANPPYLKLSKNAQEAICMKEICYGAPNMYFLFAAMSICNLKEGSEMVYIIPRSWTSGAYFKKFREYLFSSGVLVQMHLFVSRDKVFDKESVLQETMIIKIRKTTKQPEMIRITSSNANDDYHNIETLEVPYNLVVSGDERYVYLVTNEEELAVLRRVNRLEGTLEKAGAKMKTGLVVDFRNRELLREKETDNAVPLIYAQHIQNGLITFPIQRENEYVIPDKRALIQDNCNYLIVKRFTSKEEKRRLQSGIYLAENYKGYSYISTQNKVNFITGVSEQLSRCMVYGLYVVFNSTLYDKYYRILNGSTQVNSTEINAMPIPDKESIKCMGKELIQAGDLSEEVCDRILEEYV